MQSPVILALLSGHPLNLLASHYSLPATFTVVLYFLHALLPRIISIFPGFFFLRQNADIEILCSGRNWKLPFSLQWGGRNLHYMERSVTLAEDRGPEAGLEVEGARLCVTGWAAFHSSLVSREKIASKKWKISLTSEKILKEELGWKKGYEWALYGFSFKRKARNATHI
jgi:hypothetical protein